MSTAEEDQYYYDFSKTIGIISFTGDGKQYSLFGAREENSGGRALMKGFLPYMPLVKEQVGMFSEITDEFFFFSYEDEITIYMGDHWIGDGIYFARISDEDYNIIQRLKAKTGRNKTNPDKKYRYKQSLRKEYEADLDVRRTLKMQGYEVEKEYDEILSKEIEVKNVDAPSGAKTRRVEFAEASSHSFTGPSETMAEEVENVVGFPQAELESKSNSIGNIEIIENPRKDIHTATNQHDKKNRGYNLYFYMLIVLVVAITVMFGAGKFKSQK